MVRDLTLTDETYEQLADQRRDDESTADVVRRLLGVNETAGGGIEQLSPTETDELARNAMTLEEVQAAMVEQLSAGAYIRREYGVDPEDYDSEAALVEAVHEQRNSTEQRTPVTAGAGGTGGDRGSDAGATGRDVDDGVDDPDAEQLAGKVLNLNDLQRLNREGLSKREYLAEHRGVDPAEYQTEKALREALTRADRGGA